MEAKRRSADVLAQQLMLESRVPQEVKDDLDHLAEQAKGQTGRYTPAVYIIGIVALAVVVILAAVFIGLLAFQKLSAPETLATLAATALGALAGLFVPSPVANSSS